MKKIITLFALILIGYMATAQVKVGTPTGAPDPSAVLEASSNSQGFLLPRLTTIQRDAILSPANGLQIFNIDINCLQYWNGSQWISSCGNSVNGTGTPDCTSATPNGVYQVGTPTSSGNYISIPVTVATTGSWTASTDVQNGISFSGGGVFAAPGADIIKLYATPGVNPPANGIFNYVLTLGSSTCNFSINFSSQPGCTTPTPALSGSVPCAIAAGTGVKLGVTPGTTNYTSFTYSISPSAGVSAPSGTMTADSTPVLTFTNAGDYNITYTATNTGAACIATSISLTRTFKVVSGPAAPSTTMCTRTAANRVNATNGTLSAYNGTYTTTIGGGPVTITRTGSGAVANSSFAVSSPTCTDGANLAASTFNLTSAGASNTFTFSQPVSNIQLFSSADVAGDTYVILAKNGVTDISSSLVLTKLCPAQGFTISCDTFKLSSANNNGQAINIGGIYFTELTVKQISSNDIQFDFGVCNSVTNSCTTPLAIAVTHSTTPSSLPDPVVAGNTVNFAVSGGTPNVGDINYTITTSTPGMITSPLTGTVVSGNTLSLQLAAGAVGYVYANFTAANSGVSCITSSQSKKDTIQVGAVVSSITNITEPAIDYYIVNSANTAWVLYPKASGTTAGTRIAMTNTFAGADRKWNLVKLSTGQYAFYNPVNKLVGGQNSGATGAGTAMEFQTPVATGNLVASANQIYNPDQISGTLYAGGVFEIKATNTTGMNWDNYNNSFTNDNALQLYTDNSGQAQRWQLSPVQTLFAGTAVSAYNVTFGYLGGNGGAYGAQSVTSTGVTGLTAARTAGTLANGKGFITYVISGTPSATGTATFAVSIGGQSFSFTVTVSSDAIRAGLNTAGCASCTAYDAAAANTWVKITAAEYTAAAASVTSSTIYGLSETQMNTSTSAREANPFTYGYKTSAKVAVGSYVWGFSFRTATVSTAASLSASNLKTVMNDNLPATIASTDYPNATPFIPAMTLANDTRYYFVLKTPASITTSATYMGTTATIGSVIGQLTTTAVPLYYGSSIPNNGPVLNGGNQIAHMTQFMATSTKQW